MRQLCKKCIILRNVSTRKQHHENETTDHMDQYQQDQQMMDQKEDQDKDFEGRGASEESHTVLEDIPEGNGASEIMT